MSGISDQGRILKIDPYCDYLSKLQSVNIQTCEDMCNGVVLYDVLVQMEGFQLEQKYQIIEGPDGFVQALTNLKTVVKMLHQYWKNVINQSLPQRDKQINLIKIAKNKNTEQTKKLLSLVILTLFSCPQKDEFIQKMLQTQHTTQQHFMKVIKYTLPAANSPKNTSQRLTNSQGKSSDNQFPQQTQKDIIYDRLIQLQQQNQDLLHLLNQVYEQSRLSIQREKQLQAELNQKQTDIKNLTWKLKEIENSKLVDGKCWEQTEEIRQSWKENQRLLEVIKEYKDRQTQFVNEAESQRSQLRQMLNKHQELKADPSQQIQPLTIPNLSNDNLQTVTGQLNSLKSQLTISQQAITQLTLQRSLDSSTIQRLSLTCQQQQQLLLQNDHLIQSLQQQSLEPQTHPVSMQSQWRQLAQDCPSSTQMLHQQKDLLLDNRRLHQQLAHTRQLNTRLQQRVLTLERHGEQNLKLTQMITHMQKYRGEENELLVKTVYRMRMRMLGSQLNANGKDGGRRPLGEIGGGNG